MATNFPTSLDSLTNPATTDQLNSPSHAAQHANANDAIEKLQAKVGVDGSTVTTSHAYKIAQLESDVQNSLGDYIPLSVLGEPDGVAKLDADGNLIVPENKIIIEGATANAHELTLQAPDVTSDITVTLPNFSGTLATTVDVSNLGALKSNTTNPSFVINGSPTVFEPSWSAATFTGSSGLVIITSTEIASYASNHFAGDEIKFNFSFGSPWFNANGTYTIISHFTSGGSQEYFYLSGFNFIPQSGYETTSYAGPSSIWFDVYPDSKNISSTEIGYLDGVTSGIQNQINLKSNIDSPTFTGTPLAPTASAATNTTQIATTAFVSTAVSNLVNSAPNTLDTLNELATALGNDANFATTTATSIGNKVSKAGGDTITSSTASTVPLVLKGAESQTADLQEWQISSGAVVAQVTPFVFQVGPSSSYPARMMLGSADTTALLSISTHAANQIGAAIRASVSQTSNLLEFQNSSGVPITFFNASGGLTATEGVISTAYSGGKMTTGTLGYFNATTFNAAVSPIVVRGTTSQSANLTEWQNSAGTVLANVDSSGKIAAPIFQSTTGGTAYIVTGSNNNAIRIQTNGNANVGLQVRGEASQSGNLQEWQDSAGTVLAKVNNNGVLHTFAAVYTPYIQPASPTGVNAFIALDNTTVLVDGWSASTVKLTVKGYASQTANLQEWKNSAGTVLAKVDSAGKIGIGAGTTALSYGLDVFTGSARIWNGTTGAGQTGTLYLGDGSLTKSYGSGWELYGALVTTGGYGISSNANLDAGGTTLGYGRLSVNTGLTTTIGAVIRGVASQTADLQQWQNSAGTVLTKIHSGGDITLSTGRLMIVQDLGAQATIWSGSSSRTALFVGGSTSAPSAVIRAQASQTANLQEWQDSTATVLSKVDASGAMFTITPAANTNTTQVATTAYVQTELADLINSAPATLDTLKELSDALGADANFATTVTNNLALKAPLASPALTGTPTAPTAAVGTDSTQVATTAFVIDQIDASTQPGALYQTTAPTSPEIGQIWIDSDDNVTVFDSNIIRRQPFTATAGQTNFVTTVPFIDGFEQVYFNGLLLLKTTDYTTSGTNTVILGSAAAVNDIIEVVTITNLNSVNTYTQAETDALLAANTSVAPLSISANTNLLAKKRYFVTSASALTLTLPASPALNDEIQILDASGNASTYNITVARNGRLINGNAGNLIIDNNGGWYTLVYTGATYGWKVG